MNNITTHRIGRYFNVDEPHVDYIKQYKTLYFSFESDREYARDSVLKMLRATHLIFDRDDQI